MRKSGLGPSDHFFRYPNECNPHYISPQKRVAVANNTNKKYIAGYSASLPMGKEAGSSMFKKINKVLKYYGQTGFNENYTGGILRKSSVNLQTRFGFDIDDVSRVR